jgi:hypothetical protein
MNITYQQYIDQKEQDNWYGYFLIVLDAIDEEILMILGENENEMPELDKNTM